MKELGIKSYRFSFSWPRLLPEGTGRLNPEGIAYYHKLIRCLHENHITANATFIPIIRRRNAFPRRVQRGTKI